jgi:predicted hydrocarbon binding protein
MGTIKDENGAWRFDWSDLGDITEGRPNLGPDCPVIVYRLFEFTLRDALTRRYGTAVAADVLREAGDIAGEAFCTNVLDRSLALDDFVADLQRRLRELNVGNLRVERADPATMQFTLTVAEDLDCSGLPVTGETVCDYDEGFIAGIMRTYFGREFVARETDCWASGGRICRFDVRPLAADLDAG